MRHEGVLEEEGPQDSAPTYWVWTGGVNTRKTRRAPVTSGWRDVTTWGRSSTTADRVDSMGTKLPSRKRRPLHCSMKTRRHCQTPQAAGMGFAAGLWDGMRMNQQQGLPADGLGSGFLHTLGPRTHPHTHTTPPDMSAPLFFLFVGGGGGLTRRVRFRVLETVLGKRASDSYDTLGPGERPGHYGANL